MVMTLMSNPKGAVGTVVVAADGSGDTTDIQTGIDILPANGGCVYIKEGIYNINAAITINVDNTALTGCGRSTHIIQNAALSIIDTGAYDGLDISRLFLDGNAKTSLSGIYMGSSNETKIRDCWIEDCGIAGINNYSSTENLIITNNHICGCGSYGIYEFASNSSVIIGNYIDDCGQDAIAIGLGAITLQSTRGSVVVGNSIEDNNQQIFHGIHLVDGGSRNMISGNYIADNGAHGIVLGGEWHTTIQGNVIIDNSHASAGVYSGVYMVTYDFVDSKYNLIQGNEFVDEDATQKHGVKEADANQDYNTVIGNLFMGNTTSPMLINGANDVIFSNNEV